MQWVGRALSSVSQYYKEINPATLSGAVDVIVVEHEDPKDGTKTLACSPFHVRFGKLSVLRPVDRTVYVKINDTDAPYQMKVGDTGEAFFVFETDLDVPADMQTSPITGPVQDGEDDEEPDQLDLGESVSALSLQNEASRPPQGDSSNVHDAVKDEIKGKHVSRTSRLLEGTAARLQDTGKGIIDSTILADKLGKVSGKVTSHIPVHSHRDGHLDDGDLDPRLRGMEKKNAVTDEAFVASEYAGRATPRSGSESPKPFGSGVADAEGNIDSPPHSPTEDDDASVSRPAGHEHEPTKSSYYSTGSYTPPAIESGVQHELMLDMAGYKTQDDRDPDGLKTPPEMSNEQALLQERLAEGKATELHERDPDVFALTRALLRYSESKETVNKRHQRQPLNATSTDPTATFEDVNKAAADPHKFVLVSEGHYYVFEIAICPDVPIKETGALPSADEFESSRITNDDFMKSADILQNSYLFVRFQNRFFGWENGHPILATLDLYRRALLETQPRPATSSKGTWSRWWGRGQARTRTTTEESVPNLTSGVEQTSSQTEQALPLNEKPRLKEPTRSATLPPNSEKPPALAPSPSAPQVYTLQEANKSVNGSTIEAATTVSAESQQKHYAKTLRLTSDQLKALNLKNGVNSVSFTVQSSFSGVAIITARIFLWQSDYQVVISDIDGTITKSDALGHVFTMIGRDWTHPGVANLYTDIARNGYKMLYLTSRAVGQADITREYLRGVQQNGFTLPEGPVIMSPDRLFTSLHREVVLRKPEAFKMACLRDIKRLFVDRNPFYAGFGNRLTDGLSYRHVEIPSSRIFTIDSYGNVKLELLELAGYTSTYIAMANLVDVTFPPVNRSSQPAFNDFNYWRPALPEVELPDFTPQPASPALSARSDSSRMSVFRVGALAGALSKRSSRVQLQNANRENEGSKSPLSTSPRSTSPSPLQTVHNQDELGTHADYEAKDRQRRQRTESMPGSFEEDSYLSQMRDSTELASERRSLDSSRRGEDGDDGDEERDDDEDLSEGGEEETENALEDDDLPDIDFGSVPYL